MVDCEATNPKTTEVKYFFVDESGDPIIFGKKHKILLATGNVSRYFMLGALSVVDPVGFNRDILDLRMRILHDPYFQGVPSMQVDGKKTAKFFHAKDDQPEVRREVFHFLKDRVDIRFYAAIKDKEKVLQYVLDRNKRDHLYRYSENELYDFLVRRLFRDQLNRCKNYQIVFAKRQNTNRNAALRLALAAARDRFDEKYHIRREVNIQVECMSSWESGCLQATDYFLWALKRFYTDREDRYLNYLWPSFRLVVDMDDTRISNAGRYYNPKSPISLKSIPPLKK